MLISCIYKVTCLNFEPLFGISCHLHMGEDFCNILNQFMKMFRMNTDLNICCGLETLNNISQHIMNHVW